MSTFLRLPSAVAIALLAAAPLGASAQQARVTEGSTGVIGVTDSAGTPRQHAARMRSTTPATSGTPITAGEASTVVRGQPNVDPFAPGNSVAPPDTRTMGASGVPAERRAGMRSGASAWPHPMWGTPD